MTRRTVTSRGFTLLELVLVMMIMVIAVGIVAPRLANWNRGQDLRNAAEMFISVTRYARSQAIAEGTMYRIQFNAEAGEYQLKKQERVKSADGFAQFIAINTTMGQLLKVPEGGKIQLTVTTVDGQPTDTTECINFYPNGRAQKATVIISDKTGRQITAECASPMEEFHVTLETKS